MEPLTADRPPAVSVIICVYNGSRFLHETLDSVCAQTMPDLEIVAVDDGSTDGSRDLLASYADPRLKIVDHPHGGSVAALCAGLEVARGRYIGILDQDDLWLPAKLEEHCRLLDAEPDVDLTFSWYAVVDSASRRIGLDSPRSRGRYSFASLLDDYVVGPNCTSIIRASAIARAGGPDRSFPRLYDYELLLRVALLRPNNTAAVARELTLYRRHGNQLSIDWRAMQKEWGRVLDKFRASAPDGVASVAARAEVNMNRYFAMAAYEAGDHNSAAILLWSALKAAPFPFVTDLRNWRATTAATAGLILPRRLHRHLESLAGLHRP